MEILATGESSGEQVCDRFGVLYLNQRPCEDAPITEGLQPQAVKGLTLKGVAESIAVVLSHRNLEKSKRHLGVIARVGDGPWAPVSRSGPALPPLG